MGLGRDGVFSGPEARHGLEHHELGHRHLLKVRPNRLSRKKGAQEGDSFKVRPVSTVGDSFLHTQHVNLRRGVCHRPLRSLSHTKCFDSRLSEANSPPNPSTYYLLLLI